MIIQKNKAYDPTNNRAVCHFEWEVEINKESAEKVIIPGGLEQVRPDIHDWCTERFGRMVLDDWAVSTLPIKQSKKRHIVFYFKNKNDALLFKLTWN